MAKRKSGGINKALIIEAFQEMARQKNIDKDLLQGIIEETFSQLIRKKYGNEANFDIIVNMDKGDIEIYLIREVVEVVEDPGLQIQLVEANSSAQEGSYEVGDEHLTELNLENIGENFGRRMITTASQLLSQRVRDVEKDNIIAEYSDKIGEIVVGEVYQIRRDDVYITQGKIELKMPKREQIWREKYKKGENIKVLLKEVKPAEGGTQPELIVSRSDTRFLYKLLEVEIPEIYDGIIEIKGLAREAGERAKIAVASHDERVDPVGACVGMKGVRIHSIVRELSNENIDVIHYSPDPKIYIQRALAPAKMNEITVDEETRTATVLVNDDQVSLAIGKSGQNIRLAMKLTGFTIDLVKEGGEDIELVEFKDELGEELYLALLDADIETAKEFLKTPEEELLLVDGITLEKIAMLREVMLAEFDEDELREILRQKTEAANKGNATNDEEAIGIGNEAIVDSGNTATDEVDDNIGNTL